MAAKGYRVAAFEAMTTNAHILAQGVCLNEPSMQQRVKLYNVALGEKEDTCYMFSGDGNVGDGITLCGVANQAAAMARTPPKYSLHGTTHVHRLDRIISEDVQVLKMDVEGYERHVLLGALQLLTERYVPFLLTEFSRGMMGSHKATDPETFIAIIYALGYRLASGA